MMQPLAKSNRMQIQELSVYGYIRTNTKNVGIDIPDVLKQLCLSFYLIIFDIWNKEKCDPAIQVEENENMIQVKKNAAFYGWHNAFGSLVIRKGDIQEWNIKVRNDFYDGNVYVTFGIIDHKLISPKLKYFCSYGGCGYCSDNTPIAGDFVDDIGGDGDYNKDYGKPWIKGDVITMILDMTESKDKKYGILSYRINGNDLGVAKNDISLDIEWCMACSLIDDDQIQLLNV